MLHRMNASTSRRGLIPLAAAACLVALLALAASAQAARNLVTGFADHAYRTSSGDAQGQLFDTTVAEGAGVIRINVVWADVAGPSRPANPADPADPGYDFGALDGAVRQASAHGLDVMFTVYKAPPWAEGPNRPPVSDEEAPAGTWRPEPAEYGSFATALAKRYSGSFAPPAGGGPLPRVRFYEAWNEQNLWAYVAPQYEGNKQTAVEVYRSLLNAFYEGIKEGDAGAKVLFGGMAPYGDPPGGIRTRPLAFLRKILCLTKRLKPTSCPNPASFDILGTHAINLSGGPARSALDPDDVSSADVPNVAKVLRAAEDAKTIETSGRHPIWITEFWWESYPDGGAKAKPGLAKHGIWIEQALYLFWQAGAKVAINLQLIDDVFNADDPGSLQTGVFLSDGTPKPAATAFRFPFVLDRESKSETLAWGKSPQKGRLTIEKRAGGGWRKVETLKVKRNKVFKTTLSLRGKGKYRARIGDETSLVWSLRK